MPQQIKVITSEPYDVKLILGTLDKGEREKKLLNVFL